MTPRPLPAAAAFAALASTLLAAGCASEAPAPAPATPAGPSSAAEPVPVGPMDGRPPRRTASPGGVYEARVDEQGALRVGTAADVATRAPLATGVDPRVAFSPDDSLLVYARDGGLVETDLWIVALPDGEPQPLVAWPDSEDRPTFSPDGSRLAFISGVTGIASWWVIRLDGRYPVAQERARQLTNVGVDKATRPEGGGDPTGFEPPPEGYTYGWTTDGLNWFSRGLRRVKAVPE